MPIPTFDALMLPVMRRLGEQVWNTRDLVPAMADEAGLTDEERQQLLPTGRQTVIANRTHWALAYLNRAGLITRVARGQYRITDRGRSVLDASPERITVADLQHFPEFGNSRDDARDADAPANIRMDAIPQAGAATPEERLEATHTELRADLAATLLAGLRALTPTAFEQVIVDLLVKIGYGGSRQEAAERLGRSGDGGIDGVIREDALGLDAVYIQAKRYAEDNPVGAPAIQAFAGALLTNGATKGVFVTTSRFTEHARTTAQTFRSSHRLVLIDGVDLARLMIEHEVGVRTVQVIKVQRVDLGAYDDDDAV